MTTLSPMLACGPSFGPEILLIFVPWLVGILAAVGNLLAICWGLNRPTMGFRNLIFFLTYVGIGLAFAEGAFGYFDSRFGVTLFFGIPLLPIGHSIFLFGGWRNRRKADRDEMQQ